MVKKITLISVCLFLTILGGALGYTWGLRPIEPQERQFTISAKRYSFTPERIVVNKGDRVTIKLTSKDVTHGFYLEGHDIDCKIRAEYPDFFFRHPSEGEEYEQVEEFSFIADKNGKFRYRCSITCGSFHPFMQGEFVVKPNNVFNVSAGLSIGIFMAIFVYFIAMRKGEK